MAPDVLIAPVETYDDDRAIRAFVERVLAATPLVSGGWRDTARPPLVVVKPNWVQQAHEFAPDIWEPVITHPALVKAVLTYLAEAMDQRGTIALCDAPNTYADFSRILERGGLGAFVADFVAQHPGITLEIIDLRREIWITKEQVIVERRPNTPDPRGYTAVNLGRDSLFHGFHGEGRYYGADYDFAEVNRHHSGEVQEYLLAGTPMACDLFVNLPKLKTHKKTGITCSLKNLVGINGDKNWLPHHTEGTPATGGDEFPEASTKHLVESIVKKVGQRVARSVPMLGPWLFRKMRNAGQRVLGDSQTTIRNGNWSGNDTCWRMVLDLNRALLYGTAEGGWRANGLRGYVAIIDGIIGGEGNGPLCPEAVPSGVLIGGWNPAHVDAAASRLMGFDPNRVAMVREAFAEHRWPIAMRAMDELVVEDGRRGGEVPLDEVKPATAAGFEPHFGWRALRPE
ncbi:MAG TPA: DUF362 domain-containing protein [Candidatus Hydrogenedentes bacterium]|nr:DUF362 domain-containing protein [Candidatus Hydrogenedentota bacterium]HPG67794.1 DUF362 domain-containing protein [Candidatus Hydrogenedentota bacterium]